MKVLGLDTSAYANAIGIVDSKEVLAEASFTARTDALQNITSNIDAVLREANLKLDDIEGFGVGLGPGSWTGIRIGVTVAKMLAYSTGRPICGAPTLEVLAYSAGNTSSLICPIVSAGTKDAVYAAFYRRRQDALTRMGDYFAGRWQELAQLVKEPVAIVCADTSFYRQSLCPLIEGSRVEIVEAIPSGATVALLAARRLQRGEKDDALAIAPLYLKEYAARAFQTKYTAGLKER